MKYFYVNTATDAANATLEERIFPVDSMVMTDSLDGKLNLVFSGGLLGTGVGANSLITLDVANAKRRGVLEAIVQEINKGGGDDFIVLADDQNSVYFHADITAVVCVADAAS